MERKIRGRERGEGKRGRIGRRERRWRRRKEREEMRGDWKEREKMKDREEIVRTNSSGW